MTHLYMVRPSNSQWMAEDLLLIAGIPVADVNTGRGNPLPLGRGRVTMKAPANAKGSGGPTSTRVSRGYPWEP